MAPGEVRTPDKRRNDDQEQLSIGYRVRGLRRNPWAAEPLPIEEGTKAQGTWRIRHDFEVRGGRHAGKKPKIDTATEDPDEIRNLGRSGGPIYENTGADWPFDAGKDDLATQLWHGVNGQWGNPVRAWNSVDHTMTEAAPLTHRAYPREDAPLGPLSLTQCPKQLNTWTDQCTYLGEVEGLMSGRQLWKWLSSEHIG